MQSFILKHSNGKTEYITHDHYFSFDPITKNNRLRPIRKQYRQGQLELLCSCKHPRPIIIPIHYSVQDSYYIKSKDKKQHSDTCYYRYEEGEYSSPNTVYEKGFVKKDNGKIEINFDTQDFQLEKAVNQKKSMSKSVGTPLPSVKGNGGKSTNKPTIYAAMKNVSPLFWIPSSCNSNMVKAALFLRLLISCVIIGVLLYGP